MIRIHRTIAFGLRWDSDIRLRQFETADQDGVPADITVSRRRATLAPRSALIAKDNASLCIDGVRFVAGPVVTFDTLGSNRIDWMAGEAWTGEFPPVFFSTIAALVTAWRGCVPFHGSAVEVGGKGVLICGESGAGKSSLAAGLIASGGRLISDDLSIMHQQGLGRAPVLYAGRLAMRVFPSVAAHLKDPVAVRAPENRGGDKHLVLPPRVAALAPIPLACLIHLGRSGPELTTVERKAALLQGQLFRPKWMQLLPGRPQRLAAIHSAATHIRILQMPAVDARNRDAFTLGISDAVKELHGV